MEMDLNSLQFLSFSAISKKSLRIVFSWRKYGVCRTSLLSVSCLSFGIFSFSIFVLSFLFTYQDKKNSMDFPAIILSHLKTLWITYLQLIVLLPYYYIQSISSAVYSVAWIFSGKEDILSHSHIENLVQSASKRVFTTFLWSVAITGSYVFLGGFLAFSCLFFDCLRLVGAVILIFYFIGFVYISSVSHLAQVVSIMEDVHGLPAFARSKSLIRGKKGLASSIFLLGFSSATIIIIFLIPTFLLGFAPFVVVLALGLMASAMAILFLLVAQTIVYFVCQSNHDHEVENSVLAVLLNSFFDELYTHQIPSTADEDQSKSALKPYISSLKNPWIALLFAAVCTSLPNVVRFFVNMVGL